MSHRTDHTQDISVLESTPETLRIEGSLIHSLAATLFGDLVSAKACNIATTWSKEQTKLWPGWVAVSEDEKYTQRTIKLAVRYYVPCLHRMHVGIALPVLSAEICGCGGVWLGT